MKYLFLLLLLVIFTSCESGSNDSVKNCENNPCANSLVKHKTVCKDLGNDYTCVCEAGYIEDNEKRCVADLENNCENNPCADTMVSHKTVCKDLGSTYTCICEAGYTEYANGTCVKDGGGVCEVDTCTEPHFVCKEYGNSAICVCEDGYTLEDGHCAGVDPCLDSPCIVTHKTICGRITNEDYICYCDKGYAPDSDGNCVTASYGNYYSSISDDLKDNELIEALFQRIKDHTSISYGRTESKLGDIDGQVCAYTGLTGLDFNVEHVWPQSYFGGNTPMVSDLHHLRLVSSYVNSKRGNVHFGDVVKTDCNPDCYSNCSYDNNCAETNSCCYFCDWDGVIHSSGVQTEAKKGKPTYNCSDYPVFEVMDDSKGDVARSLFYFAVRYKNQDINQSQAYLTGPDHFNHIPPYEESVLRRWHREDPVSQAEINRNNKIFAIQKNRNPFIDRPDLVDRISDF